MEPIRILLVDDHDVVRVGLTFLITSQPDMSVVAEAGNGEDAVALYLQHRPDVVLMDLKLPDMSGIDCTSKIRDSVEDARIIVLTTYEGDEYIYRAFQAGARAYLLKDMGRTEIVETIRAVHQGQRRMPPLVANQLAQRLPESDLSVREMEILKLISRGLSNKEIGSVLSITESTVKGHVKHLIAKLRARDRTEAVTIALKRGLIMLE